MRRLLLTVSVGLLLLAACAGDGGDDAASDAVDVSGVVLAGLGPEAPEIAFADHEGRPVVVNFFASTCVPCVAEMPAIERVKQAAAGRLDFVGVATNDRAEDALELVDRTGVTWEFGTDPNGSFIRQVGGIGLPTTALVDEDGRVVFAQTGELSDRELVGLVREHLDVDIEL
ncbi:MAG: TlpA family protein disulfide reductase [Acidimicrobiales bacterium]